MEIVKCYQMSVLNRFIACIVCKLAHFYNSNFNCAPNHQSYGNESLPRQVTVERLHHKMCLKWISINSSQNWLRTRVHIVNERTTVSFHHPKRLMPSQLLGNFVSHLCTCCVVVFLDFFMFITIFHLAFEFAYAFINATCFPFCLQNFCCILKLRTDVKLFHHFICVMRSGCISPLQCAAYIPHNF